MEFHFGVVPFGYGWVFPLGEGTYYAIRSGILAADALRRVYLG